MLVNLSAAVLRLCAKRLHVDRVWVESVDDWEMQRISVPKAGDVAFGIGFGRVEVLCEGRVLWVVRWSCLNAKEVGDGPEL